MNKDENVIWVNPMPNCSWSIPLGKYHPSGFGSRRKHNLHTGVDLICEHMQPVASVEDGIVVSIESFTKKKNKSSWLNKTKAILVEGQSGVVAYCNVLEKPGLKINQQVSAGEIIGNVIRINRHKKQKDICMLHFELYLHGIKKRTVWSCLYPKPPQLLDPSKYLLRIITETVLFKRPNK